MKKELWISKNRPFVFFMLIIFSMALWSLQFIFPAENFHQIQSHPGILDFDFREIIKGRFLNVFIGYLVFLINILILYKINSRFQIVDGSAYMVIWLYLFITCIDYRYLYLSNELISGTFFLLSVFVFLGALNKKPAIIDMFHAGFLMFIASLVYVGNIPLIVFFIFSLAFYKMFYWRDYANLLLGIISGAIITSGILYLTDSLHLIGLPDSIISFFSGIEIPIYNILLMDFILGIVFIIAVIYQFMNYGFLKKERRIYLKIILFMMLIMMVLYLFSGMQVMFRFYLAAPLAIILTFYLKRTKNTILAFSINWFIFALMLISEILAVLNNLST